jgi:hypothetical protein
MDANRVIQKHFSNMSKQRTEVFRVQGVGLERCTKLSVMSNTIYEKVENVFWSRLIWEIFRRITKWLDLSESNSNLPNEHRILWLKFTFEIFLFSISSLWERFFKFSRRRWSSLGINIEWWLFSRIEWWWTSWISLWKNSSLF